MMPRIKNKRHFYKQYSALSRQQQWHRRQSLMNQLKNCPPFRPEGCSDVRINLELTDGSNALIDSPVPLTDEPANNEFDLAQTDEDDIDVMQEVQLAHATGETAIERFSGNEPELIMLKPVFLSSLPSICFGVHFY